MEHLLNIPYEFIDLCAEEGICIAGACEFECNAITAGSVVIGLHNHKLFPRPKREDLDISVMELAKLLKDIPIYEFPGKEDSEHGDWDCEEGELKKDIDEAIGKITVPVLEQHLRHMQAQNKRLAG